MKKIFILIIVCILLTLSPIYAHSGRTDSSGGHYNRSTGEYHYHHGHSAHQHPNGICPYSNNTNNNNDNTTTSIPSSSKSYENNTTKSETSNKSSSGSVSKLMQDEMNKIREKEKQENTNTKNNTSDSSGWLCLGSTIVYIAFIIFIGIITTKSKKE